MLAEGFHRVLEPGALAVVCNTGDDTTWNGIHVSPDVDAVLYRLAGLFDEERRFGIRGDTFNAVEQLATLGEEAWFRLGDRDLAICLLRTQLLRTGSSPSEATAELCRRLGVHSAVAPMTDGGVRTWIGTAAGRFDVQEWFIRERQAPRVVGIEVEGVESGPSPAAVEFVEGADLVVIGPSNPAISIEPILAVLGPHVPRERTVAVTPIVAGAALKGPTVRMLEELGREPTPKGIAAGYRDLAARFVLDARDADQAEAVRALGYSDVLVLDTVMGGREGRERLAREILDLA